MKGKKFLALSFAAALMVGSAMSVSAAGVADVFDAGTYSGKYADLKAAFGNDSAALLKHFMTSGAKEGRVMSPILDVVAYRAAYGDLNAAFGDDWDAYVDHYLTYGIKEGRKEGVLFDLADYANKNSDVKATYGDDYAAIAQHYVNYGMKEGRPGGSMVKAVAATNSSSSSSAGTTKPVEEKPSEEKPAEETPTAPAHSHDWVKNAGKSMPATCDQPGYDYYECQGTVTVNGQTIACTATTTLPTSAKHTMPTDTSYAICATCTQSGLVKYTCTVCGDPQSEVIPALGHDYDKNTDRPVAGKSKISTCKEAGYDFFTCKRCGVECKENRELAKHSVAQWNVTKTADCTHEGERQGWCSTCGLNITEATGRTNHNVTAATTGITVVGDGKTNTAVTQHQKQTINYCAVCGYITAASDPELENCTDTAENGGTGNGKCDICKLDMNRGISNSAKIYNVGDYYFSVAH